VAVEPVFRHRPVVFTDYLQGKPDRPRSDAKRDWRGDYAGEQSAEGGDPFETKVAVVRKVREVGNCGCGGELRGVMKLQAGIGQSRRFFRSNGLPGSW
jgi:hypothetical protein